MMGFIHPRLFLTVVTVVQILEYGQSHLLSITQSSEEKSYVSVLGDPGMKNPNSRFALEAWNFCNEVGMEAPHMGSPRMADCADLYCPENIAGLLFLIVKFGIFLQKYLMWFFPFILGLNG